MSTRGHSLFAMSEKRGSCVYNSKWETISAYSKWIKAFNGDKQKANSCTFCDRVLDISTWEKVD